jgi:hypothetical protein
MPFATPCSSASRMPCCASVSVTGVRFCVSERSVQDEKNRQSSNKGKLRIIKRFTALFKSFAKAGGLLFATFLHLIGQRFKNEQHG